MSVLILIVGLVGWALCIHLKKQKLGLFLQLFSFAWIFLITTGVLPNLLLNPLENYPQRVKYKFGYDNAIILLGSGVVSVPGDLQLRSSVVARVFEASRLYYECKQTTINCKIIVSGGDPMKSGRSEADVMALELSRVGVHSDDIILEKESRNTFENARHVAEILKNQNLPNRYLVTSGFHMFRSLLYFSHFKIIPVPAPADYLSPRSSKLQFSQQFYAMDIAAHEYAGIIRYYLYNLIGWND